MSRITVNVASLKKPVSCTICRNPIRTSSPLYGGVIVCRKCNGKAPIPGETPDTVIIANGNGCGHAVGDVYNARKYG